MGFAAPIPRMTVCAISDTGLRALSSVTVATNIQPTDLYPAEVTRYTFAVRDGIGRSMFQLAGIVYVLCVHDVDRALPRYSLASSSITARPAAIE